MNAVVFYFSGSGYSYLVARDLAKVLHSEIVPLKYAVNTPPDFSKIDTIGFVFPVYHASYGLSGLPFIVEHFLDGLGNLEDKYIFGICTHGGKPGAVLRSFEKKIKAKGGKLSYGLCVRLSVPYKTDEKIRAVFLRDMLSRDTERDEEVFSELYSEWMTLVPKISARIEHRKACVMIEGYDTGLLKSVGNILQLKMAKARYRELSGSDSDSFEILVNQSDAGFRVLKSCVKCGLCSRICPVGNVETGVSGPEWQGRCENCFACYHWCPQAAITGPLVEFEKHMTPTDVSADDLL